MSVHIISTAFATEWNVRKASIASFILDWKQQGRQWCVERWTWTTEWNEIVFTDESCFCPQHRVGRIRVWTYRGERQLNYYSHSGPATDIMVCGGIGFHSRIPLVCIAGKMNSQRYISEMLEPVVIPYIQTYSNRIMWDHTWHVMFKSSLPISLN
ncbi:transposable element Tcb1 transposase [Trichonephila clavipes]|nr:transposable element Tcb1 transposase [Trichonephila clavipes]